MRTRFSKVRVTSYRQAPPGAGAPTPLERRTARPGAAASGKVSPGLEYLLEAQKREREWHDKWVSTYSPALLEAAYEDLKDRPAWNWKDPEHRFVMGRRAALVRRGQAMVKGRDS